MSDINWQKASYSTSNQNCVEVRRRDAEVRVRDSEDPAGPVLIFPGSTWGVFLARLKDAPASVS